MKTQIRITIILLSLTFSIVSQSCQKEPLKKPVLPSRVAKDNAIAEAAFADLGNQMQAGMQQAQAETENGKGINLMNSTCATITISPYDWTTFPKTITIDYGLGCLGNDGKLRTGIITVHTTGWYREEGTVITVTTDDYTVNGNAVEGIQVTTNNGRNLNNNIYYTVFIEGTVTTPEGTVQITSEREHEWIAGEPTLFNPWDDEYLLTGWQNGQTIEGDEYQIQVTEPLHIKLNCGHVVAGKLTINSDGFQDTIYVDYGSGDCDNIAIATYMGQEYTIILQ
jgi:hypothetical protein